METTPMRAVRPPSRLEEKQAARRKRRLLWALLAAAVLVGVAGAAMAVGGWVNDGVKQEQPIPTLPTESHASGHRPIDRLPATPTATTPSSAPATTSRAPRTTPELTSPPRATQGPRSATTAPGSTTTVTEPGGTETTVVTQPGSTSTSTVTETVEVPPPDCADPQVECACDHDPLFDCEGNPRIPPTTEATDPTETP